jgi:hypothetical protein
VAPSGQHNVAICHSRPQLSPERWTPSAGRALWSRLGDEASATATVLIRSPYSCWLAPGMGTLQSAADQALRPLPGTTSSLHGDDPLHTDIDNLLSIREVQAPSPSFLDKLILEEFPQVAACAGRVRAG